MIARAIVASKTVRAFLLLCGVTLIAASCAPKEQRPPHQGMTEDGPASWDSMLGLVTGTAYGACLTTAPGVTPSTTVAVIMIPDGRIIAAAVTGAGESCPGDVSGFEGVSYRLSSSEIEAGEIGVAVLPNAPVIIDGRTDLDADGVRESFRMCTSHEGVHVTAWAGEPLTSRRVWHRYHYLGYDVDPSCTDVETG